MKQPKRLTRAQKIAMSGGKKPGAEQKKPAPKADEKKNA